jgi:hypothetical protein
MTVRLPRTVQLSIRDQVLPWVWHQRTFPTHSAPDLNRLRVGVAFGEGQCLGDLMARLLC